MTRRQALTKSGPTNNPAGLSPQQASVYTKLQAYKMQTNKLRKVILSRFLLGDGHVTFSVGTRFGGTVIRNTEEVPLAEICDHVSPQELQRFENQEFLNEDERERNEPKAKIRGRPKKNLQPLLTDQDDTSREVSTVPAAQISKPRGRPRNVHPSFDLGGATSREESVVPNVSVIVKKAPGRPRKYPVPSFEGPQPTRDEVPATEGESSTRESSESSANPYNAAIGAPRQYSMMAASGLGPGVEHQDETSREISPTYDDLEATPKKRRTESRLSPHQSLISILNEKHAAFSTDEDETSLQEDKSNPIVSLSPEAEDASARPLQFQAKASSDSDSLMSRAVEESPEPTPTQSTTQLTLPKIKVSTPTKTATNPRRISSTPHFPHGSTIISPRNKRHSSSSASPERSLFIKKQHASTASASKSSLLPTTDRGTFSSPTKPSPVQITPPPLDRQTFSSPNGPSTSPPTSTHKRKRSPELRASITVQAQPKPPAKPSPSKLGPTISHYFAPKAVPTRHQELVVVENSDSEDPIAQSPLSESLRSPIAAAGRSSSNQLGRELAMPMHTTPHRGTAVIIDPADESADDAQQGLWRQVGGDQSGVFGQGQGRGGEMEVEESDDEEESSDDDSTSSEDLVVRRR
ncbi:hypothetical protein MMC28_003823 [Mycoblastus sanguinarius]|nr:hypothetical protein [Mycoblastus sanguinarius]